MIIGGTNRKTGYRNWIRFYISTKIEGLELNASDPKRNIYANVSDSLIKEEHIPPNKKALSVIGIRLRTL
jgi:hypothetical protein